MLNGSNISSVKICPNSYDEEWCRLFSANFFCIQNLRDIAIVGELRNCRFRSICWRIYLEILGENSNSWKEEVIKLRNIYISLRDKYIIDPRQKNSSVDDPLSIHGESVWNKFFQSQDIIKEIEQDVVRTFPEIEFFQSSIVRTSMINILYCYSQTSHLKYRQGMHEILAPLIFVLHCDQIAYEHSSEVSNLSVDVKNVGGVLLDSKYLEHDSYSMFVSLMKVIEHWYDSKTVESFSCIRRFSSTSQRHILTDPQPFTCRNDPAPVCSIGQLLSSIHHNILKRLDLDLYLHLDQLEISPQIFGLRWLRLLFGREFTLQDLLMVWDVIFAIGDNFALVNYIYVSMLIYIRDFLLNNNFTVCLTQLMKYPTNVDVNHIVELALHFFNPDVYEKPVDQTRSVASFSLAVAGNNNYQKRVQRNKTISGIETLTHKFTSLINKKSPIVSQSRPNVLKNDKPVFDSVTVSPSYNHCQDRDAQTQATDDMDHNKIVNVCIGMVDDSIECINKQNIDQALAILKHARDILSGNLIPNNVAIVSQELNIHDISRSMSNNDIFRQTNE